ncbi:MAG TPA: glycosyltransferase family 39 protein [Gammaproteobacteria bacterium]|nr:glycosyltransferase family 39 protein [Gammaproteobacteria bacterium]
MDDRGGAAPITGGTRGRQMLPGRVLTDRRALYRGLLLLAVVAMVVALYLGGLGAYPLANATESLYAEIAREMLRTGHFIVPRLDGAVYLQKPPLLYWLADVSFAAFGVGTAAARLVCALAGLATIVVTGAMARRFSGRRGALYAALTLATSGGFLFTAHVFFFATLLTLWTAIALLAGYRWYETGARRALRLAALALALGVLTKGLVALAIVGLPGIGLLARGGRRGRWRELPDPWAIGLFLGVTAPWFVLGAIHLPGFLHDVLWNEQFGRFFGTRVPDDYYHGPLYFYLPILAADLLPWVMIVPALVLGRSSAPTPAQRRLGRFAWIWILSNLVFFSLSADKGNYYLVPVLPAAALLLGMRLERLERSRPRRSPVYLLVPLTVPLVFLALRAFIGDHGLQLGWIRGGGPWRAVWTVMGLLGSGAAVLGLRGRIRAGAVALAAMMAPLLGLLILAYRADPAPFSAAPLAPLVRRMEAGGVARVVAAGRYDPVSALPFYLRRQVPVVGYDGAEFAYARAHPGQGAGTFAHAGGLVPQLKRGRAVIVARGSDPEALGMLRQRVPALQRLGSVGPYVVYGSRAGSRGGHRHS